MVCPQNLRNVCFVWVFWVFFSLVFSNFLPQNFRPFKKVAAFLNESTTLPFIPFEKMKPAIRFLFWGIEWSPKQKGKQNCLIAGYMKLMLLCRFLDFSLFEELLMKFKPNLKLKACEFSFVFCSFVKIKCPQK